MTAISVKSSTILYIIRRLAQGTCYTFTLAASNGCAW